MNKVDVRPIQPQAILNDNKPNRTESQVNIARGCFF